jgi:excisionase family DNA binding protein
MSSSSNARTLSPWLTASEAAEYLKRGRRFILREIKSGRLRGAIVGGRREVLTRAEWCDQWVADHTTPVAFTPRRRA